MLSAKEIYNAANHNLTNVKWERAGDSEWIFVGEEANFLREVLLAAAENVCSSGRVYAVLNRNTVSECSTSEAVEFVRKHQPTGDVIVCDKAFGRYLQVSRVGVYRFGTLPANPSLKADPP